MDRKTRIRATMNVDATKVAVADLIFQQAIYAGMPCTVEGLRRPKDVHNSVVD